MQNFVASLTNSLEHDLEYLALFKFGMALIEGRGSLSGYTEISGAILAMADLRKRRGDKQDGHKEPSGSDADSNATLPTEGNGSSSKEKQLEPGSYWLTRIVFIRALGFIYCK